MPDLEIPVSGSIRGPVSAELLRDNVPGFYEYAHAKIAAGVHEAVLDITVGPRFGPPAPRVEVPEERCPECGHLLDEDDWDY